MPGCVVRSVVHGDRLSDKMREAARSIVSKMENIIKEKNRELFRLMHRVISREFRGRRQRNRMMQDCLSWLLDTKRNRGWARADEKTGWVEFHWESKLVDITTSPL